MTIQNQGKRPLTNKYKIFKMLLQTTINYTYAIYNIYKKQVSFFESYRVLNLLKITKSREGVAGVISKPPGEDGIPGEIFKHGGVKLSEELHKFINT